MLKSRLYSVDEICTLFHIDRATLRRWRNKLQLFPAIDPSHGSRRLYSAAQVLALAHSHRRFAVLPELAQEHAGELAQSLVEMERRLLVAEQQIAELRGLLAEQSGPSWGVLRLVGMDE